MDWILLKLSAISESVETSDGIIVSKFHKNLLLKFFYKATEFDGKGESYYFTVYATWNRARSVMWCYKQSEY